MLAIKIHLGAPTLPLVGIVRSPDKSHLESGDAKDIHKNDCLRLLAYLIFVIFVTQARFLEPTFYTENCVN